MLGVLSSLGSWFLGALVPSAQKQLKTLGETIRRFRIEAGLTQESLAEKADLHPVYIGKIERGEQWISLHALLRVAQAMGIRAKELLTDL